MGYCCPNSYDRRRVNLCSPGGLSVKATFGQGKRFIVKADDLLTAFLSLERDAIAPKGANGNATP